MKAPGMAILVIFLLSNLKMAESLFNEFTATPLLILGPNPETPVPPSIPNGS